MTCDFVIFESQVVAGDCSARESAKDNSLTISTESLAHIALHLLRGHESFIKIRVLLARISCDNTKMSDEI